MTISLVLDRWCSEALLRMMLVWLMCDQSDIMCFLTFFTNHGVESALNAFIQKQQILSFWIQFNIWRCFNLQKSPSWKCKSPLKSPKLQNRPPQRIKSPPMVRFRACWRPPTYTVDYEKLCPRLALFTVILC